VVRLSFAYSGTLHAGTIDHCIVRAAVTEHSTALQQKGIICTFGTRACRNDFVAEL
jgi:hypothetical protein